MTILVTGGTGLVGARLLPRLVEAGMDCRALVRSGKDVPAGATAVEGDLFNPSSLARAVEGVSAIIHLAAVFRTPEGFGAVAASTAVTSVLAAARAPNPSARPNRTESIPRV